MAFLLVQMVEVKLLVVYPCAPAHGLEGAFCPYIYRINM